MSRAPRGPLAIISPRLAELTASKVRAHLARHATHALKAALQLAKVRGALDRFDRAERTRSDDPAWCWQHHRAAQHRATTRARPPTPTVMGFEVVHAAEAECLRLPKELWPAPPPRPAELPADWGWSTLGVLAELGSGGMIADYAEQPSRAAPWPWVSADVIAADADVVLEPSGWITSRDLMRPRMSLYPEGSIIVAVGGGGPARGRCALLGITAAVSKTVAVIALREPAKGLARYLRCALAARYHELRELGEAEHLPIAALRGLAVPVPPPDIAEAVIESMALARIDRDRRRRLLVDELHVDEQDRLKRFDGPIITLKELTAPPDLTRVPRVTKAQLTAERLATFERTIASRHKDRKRAR